jgi:flagellar motor component MotA
MNRIICILIIATAVSCFPSKKACERRIARYVDNYPSLNKKDTITVIDTIPVLIESIKHDTLVEHDIDSFTIVKDKLRIKYVRRDSLIYIEGECKSDTIYKIVKQEIAYEKIEVRDSKPEIIKLLKYFPVLLVVAGVVLLIKLFKKNGNKKN